MQENRIIKSPVEETMITDSAHMKSPKDKLSRNQKQTLEAMQQLGMPVYVLTVSVKEPVELVEIKKVMKSNH